MFKKNYPNEGRYKDFSVLGSKNPCNCQLTSSSRVQSLVAHTCESNPFAPGLPVPAQAALEGLRLLGVEPLAEVEGLGGELLLA